MATPVVSAWIYITFTIQLIVILKTLFLLSWLGGMEKTLGKHMHGADQGNRAEKVLTEYGLMRNKYL